MTTAYCLLLAALVPLASTEPTSNEPHSAPDVYELTLSATLPLLPAPVAEFVASDSEVVRAELLRACDAKGEPGGEEASRHHIKLDAGAESEAWPDRLRAASAFPADRAEAQKLWTARKVRAGGALPWAMEEECRQLFDAFRQSDRERIVRGVGRVVHLATDASLPFRTVSDRVIAESPTLCASERAVLASVQCHPADRIEVVLPARLRERFAYEIRVAPGRVHQIDDLPSAIIEHLRATHRTVPTLLTIDREVLTSLRVSDADHFAASIDAYYAHLADRVAPIMEDRIERAALFSADLILTAWVRAGRPPLTAKSGPTGEQSASTGAPEAGSPNAPGAAIPEIDAGFAGSANSTVFHRTDCPHLRRIKPENLVRFKSLEEAKAQGKTPCRTCKPDQPK